MDNIITNKYIVKILDRNAPDYKETINKVFRLRYNDMILEYNKDAKNEGIDCDEYDEYCDHLVAIDSTTNEVVGTYRFIQSKHITNLNNKFLLENEFNIDEIKKTGKRILEVGRAVVSKEHRDGGVITLLWKALFQYIVESKIEILLGTASFHGTDANIYSQCLTCIKQDFSSTYNAYAINNVASMDNFNDTFNQHDAIKEMPPLIKGYIRVGARFGRDMFIDTEFCSVDVLVILEVDKMNSRYLGKFSHE